MSNGKNNFKIRLRWVVAAAVCVAIGLAAFGWFNNPGRGQAPDKEQDTGDDGIRLGGDGEPGEAANTADGSYVEGELVGLFESEEEAIACAELYGIELLSFNNRVAVFSVEGDLKKLIEKGKENGWPELSLNYVYSFFE